MYSPQPPSDGNPDDGALARPRRQLSTASAADSLAVFALAKLIDDRATHQADPQLALALAFAICARFQVSASIIVTVWVGISPSAWHVISSQRTVNTYNWYSDMYVCVFCAGTINHVRLIILSQAWWRFRCFYHKKWWWFQVHICEHLSSFLG